MQISGVDYPGKAQIIAARIRAALQEFRTFEHWLDEYNAHQAGAEMGRKIGDYHLFDRVLRRSYPFEEPPEINASGASDYRWSERLNYRVKRFLFAKADRERPGRDYLLKRLLAGCRGCDHCILPDSCYICLRNCPKWLMQGPCGEVSEDGTCPISGEECDFVQKSRCSKWREEISCLDSKG